MGTGPANRRSMRSAWRGSDAGAMRGFWISTSRASFDRIDSNLLMRAVRKHTDCPWVLLYIERWLKAPIQMADGSLVARERGTPQGGVISPILSNLFLHYTFDIWMRRNHPAIPFERYADDVICHCRSEEQARTLRASLETRFAECGLTLHPDKTKVVYCKDDDRRGDYPDQKFDFLGYTFRPRLSRRRNGFGVSFSPAVSGKALRSIRQTVRHWILHERSDKTLDDLARMFNNHIRGWINYYGRFYKSALYPALRHIDRILARWAHRKFKSLRRHKRRTHHWLLNIVQQAAKPTGPDYLGTDSEAGGRLPPETPHPSSLAFRAVCRHSPEVGAECLNGARSILRGALSNACPLYVADCLQIDRFAEQRGER